MQMSRAESEGNPETVMGYIQASLPIPTTMNDSFPAIKADVAVSGDLVAFGSGSVFLRWPWHGCQLWSPVSAKEWLSSDTSLTTLTV